MEQFTFVKRGYDPEEVDKYITTLEQVIKSYKDKDNAIKNSIISAQKTSDDIVKNAHKTAEDIVRNAQLEAETFKPQMGQMGDQLVGIRSSLDRQRASLHNFQTMNANAIRKCIQELEQFDMNEMFLRIDEMDAAIAALHGLEASNKERLMQSQNMDPRSMVREPSNITRDQEPRDHYPRDTGRDIMRPQAQYDPMRETRDMRGHDMDRPRDVMRETGMDMMRNRTAPPPMPRETVRDTSRDMMVREQQPYAPQETMRETMPRDPYAPQATGRDMMPQEMPPYAPRDTGREMMHNNEMMRPPVRDYAPEPPRELIRDTRPRSDFGRDIRRDYGRDMRSDSGRDVRRDDYDTGRLGRLDGREPMREMPRQYAPDPDNYDDQNLLPPVASLM